MMNAFGLNASLVNETISVNGTSVELHKILEMAHQGGQSDDNKPTQNVASSSIGTGQVGIVSKEPSSKKLKKIISDLEDELRDIKSKAKDRKDEIAEKAKLIATLTQQLTRAQTSIRHKEFQNEGLKQEREQAIEELDGSLRRTHEQHLQSVLADNQSILQQQHKLLQQVPENLRVFTSNRQTLQQKFKETGQQLMEERDAAMKKLSIGQKQEIKHLKLQYEHWLNVKNTQIKEFAEQFNNFREEKNKQLQACEKEIVRLYNHTHKLQTILTGVEQGEYAVTQKQSSIGRPTTGVIMALDENYDTHARCGPRTPATREEMASLTLRKELRQTAMNQDRVRTAPGSKRGGSGMIDYSIADGGPNTVSIGGIVLPKGLRPNNPFVAKSEDLSLSKKIVSKYKLLEDQVQKIQESTFQDVLEKAGGGKTLGVLDPSITSQIKGMLTTSSMSREGQTFVNISPKKKVSNGDMAVGEAVMEEPSAELKNITLQEYEPSTVSSSNNMAPDKVNLKRATSAPGPKLDADEVRAENEYLKEQIEELHEQIQAEKLRTEKVVRNLQSDEILQYIQTLEANQAKLHKNLKEVSSQLHSSKISNTSLMRRLEKVSLSKSLDLSSILPS